MARRSSRASTLYVASPRCSPIKVSPWAWSSCHRAHAADTAAGDELSGNDVALNLVGALPDDHQRRVAEVALDVVFGRIAVAAVDPHRAERDLHRRLRGEQLRHPGLHVAAVTGVVTLRGVQHKLAGGGVFRSHVRGVGTD